MTHAKKKILIISHDKIGSQMAGPGIRYHYMAETLQRELKCDVTVGFFDPTYLPDESFQHTYAVRSVDAFHFQQDFAEFDTVIALWLSDSMMAFCNLQNIFIVFDIYAPVPVENLASSLYSGKIAGNAQDYEYKQSLSMYRKFFENGDLFLFSNQRQLDYWTGYVFGSDLVRTSTYAKRPFFDRFIYAPMGIDAKQPLKHTKKVMRGVIPGITDTDKVMIWTGGIWGWYDGAVLIRAMKLLVKSRPDIKLVFFGTKHPNPSIKEMQESLDTRRLAAEFGLTDKTVFFLDGWTPYAERLNYLLEADLAVNTHKMSIETEFSHRTRVLDHLLAGLPTIGTQGDYLSDEVISRLQLGVTVAPGDEKQLKQTILEVLEPAKYKSLKNNIQAARGNYDWSRTLSPLIDALSSSPSRLYRLPSKNHHDSMLRKIAKRILPKPVKKAIIKALKYGK